MAQAWSSAFDPATLDLAIKAMTLLLLLGAAAALWEVIRYVRALRHGRELNHRLTLQRMHDEMGNDPRLAAAVVPVRQGLFGRFVRKSLQTLGMLTVLIVAAAAMAMPFLGTWLEHEDYLEKADYIVPLPGDSQRLFKAADLYKQGFAPRVLLSRGTEEAARASQLRLEAGYPSVDFDELQLRTLEKAGVPRGSAVLIDTSDATIANTADALKRYVEGRKVRVIVITSGIHAMRTRLTFEDAVPRARVIVVSATGRGGEPPWWSSQDTALQTLAEATRVAHHWVGHGLRSVRSEPDALPKATENLGAGREARQP